MSEEDHNNKLRALETYSKLKDNLVRGAPIFNRNSDFESYTAAIFEYLAELPYITEPLRKSVLKSSCTGIAQEYLSTIPALASHSFDSLLSLL